MTHQIHPVVSDVESLVRSKLIQNGNAQLADPTRWISTVEGNKEGGYGVTVALFSHEAEPLTSLFSADSGFRKLECGDYYLSDIPEVEIAISLISLILDFSFAYTPTEVEDLELSSFRHFGECMPWEVLSYMYFGDPRLDTVAENQARKGGDI